MPAREIAARFARLGLRGLDRARGERVEHVLDDVLRRQPLDQLGLLQPDRRQVGDRAEQVGVLVAELPLVGQTANDPELLVASDQRRDQQRAVVEVRPQRPLHPGAAVRAAPAGAPHQVEHEAGAPGTGTRRRGTDGVGPGQRQLVALDVKAVDLAGVGSEQLAGPAGDHVVEVLPHGHTGQRLAQLREGGERPDAPAGLGVELGVLDRAADQRRGVDEEVEDVVVELARRLRVQDDHPDHVAGLGEDRYRDHRLEALLLELGDVLHPRVLHRVLADELRGLRPGDPARQALVDAEPQLADEARVARRRRAQRQPVALEEVDEAGVAAGRVGGDLDDAVQHPVEVERRRDRLDHRVERLVLAPRPFDRVIPLRDHLHRQARPPFSLGEPGAVRVFPGAGEHYGPILHSGLGKYGWIAHCQGAPDADTFQPSVGRKADDTRVVSAAHTRRGRGWSS